MLSVKHGIDADDQQRVASRASCTYPDSHMICMQTLCRPVDDQLQVSTTVKFVLQKEHHVRL